MRFNPLESRIPSYWELAPLKYVTRSTSGGTPTKSNSEYWDGDIPWISSEDVRNQSVNDSEEYITSKGLKESSATLVPANSILIVSRSGILKHTIPVEVNDKAVAINQDILALIPTSDEVIPGYIKYLINGHNDLLLNLWKSRGATVESIDSQRLKTTKVPLPPVEDQELIVKTLNSVTAKIDRIIKKKEQAINLFNKKGNVLIEDLLSEVSESDTAKIKYITDTLPGYAFPSDDFTSDPEDIPLLRGTNIGVGEIRWEDVAYWPRNQTENYEGYLLKPGDIILGMDRPWIKSGIRVARMSESDCPSLLVQRVLRIRAKPGVDQEYIRMALESERFKQYFEPITTGVSVPHISESQVTGFEVPLPDLDCQKEISSIWRKFRSTSDKLIDEIDISIDLHNEFKHSLISEVVTGQFDVTGAKTHRLESTT